MSFKKLLRNFSAALKLQTLIEVCIKQHDSSQV